jgi:signal transduction histidine kinase
VARDLRPAALDGVGLLTAVRRYTEDWSQRYRIEVDVHGIGLDSARLPPHLETTLYRVVQEAMTNVLKHAQAGRVGLILERRRAHVLVIVEDDGRGFDADAVLDTPGARRGLGLVGMRERVELAGGTLQIESTPGRGTTVFARIPL